MIPKVVIEYFNDERVLYVNKLGCWMRVISLHHVFSVALFIMAQNESEIGCPSQTGLMADMRCDRLIC